MMRTAARHAAIEVTGSHGMTGMSEEETETMLPHSGAIEWTAQDSAALREASAVPDGKSTKAAFKISRQLVARMKPAMNDNKIPHKTFHAAAKIIRSFKFDWAGIIKSPLNLNPWKRWGFVPVIAKGPR